MPNTPIPLNQPPKAILLALLNRDNETSFTLNQIDFTSMAPTTGSFARNTKITVEALPAAPYSGSEDVYYNRLHLDKQWENTLCVAHVNNPTNAVDLLDSINSLYGLAITPADIVNNPVSGSTHTLTASTSSLIWLGAVEVTIMPEAISPDITLGEEFTDALTPGFIYDENKDYGFVMRDLMYEMITEMNSSPVQYNAGHFTISSVTLGPSANVGIVTLASTPGSGFIDDYVLEYTRLPITLFFSSSHIPDSVFLDLGYEPGQQINNADIISVLSNMTGLAIGADDFNISNVLLNEGHSFTVQSSNNNYLTYGVITLNIVSESMSLLEEAYDEHCVICEQPDGCGASLTNACSDALDVINNPAAPEEDILSARDDILENLPADNKDDLESSIESVNDLTEGDYTPDSWQELQDAVSDAEDAFNDPHATQAQVDAANTALQDAINALVPDVPPVDKAALSNALSTASGLDENEYTPESWLVLQNAVTDGQTVYDDVDATQTEVDQAAFDIGAAISGLVPAQAGACVIALSDFYSQVSGDSPFPVVDTQTVQVVTPASPVSGEVYLASDFDGVTPEQLPNRSTEIDWQGERISQFLITSAITVQVGQFSIGDNGFFSLYFRYESQDGAAWVEVGSDRYNFPVFDEPENLLVTMAINGDGAARVKVGDALITSAELPPLSSAFSAGDKLNSEFRAQHYNVDQPGDTCNIEWITDGGSIVYDSDFDGAADWCGNALPEPLPELTFTLDSTVPAVVINNTVAEDVVWHNGYAPQLPTMASGSPPTTANKAQLLQFLNDQLAGIIDGMSPETVFGVDSPPYPDGLVITFTYYDTPVVYIWEGGKPPDDELWEATHIMSDIDQALDIAQPGDTVLITLRNFELNTTTGQLHYPWDTPLGFMEVRSEISGSSAAAGFRPCPFWWYTVES